MQQRSVNFLKMTATVLAGMDNEKNVWANEPEIAGVVSHVSNVFNSIDGKNLIIMGVDTTGLTSVKDNLFDTITHGTLKLALKMSAYAKLKKDYVLLPLVDVSLTTLSRGIEKDAVSRCSAIIDRAAQMLPQLASFKVTAEQLELLRARIGEYNNSVTTRSTAVSNVTASGEEIAAGIADLREQLDILDDLVEGILDDEAFMARYKQWRKIIDYGVGKTAKKAEKNGEPQN